MTTLKSGSGCDPGDGGLRLQEKGSACFPSSPGRHREGPTSGAERSRCSC